MSTLKTNNVQVGQSVTATNNFTLYQPASPDGTIRLGVGNAGATTSDVISADSSGNFKFNSGYGSATTAYGCRAWVNFNGTGTPAIRNSSSNVTSISDNGTGDYTVNTSAFVDANFAVVGTASGDTAACIVTITQTTDPLPTTTAIRFRTRTDSGTLVDREYIGIAVFR